MVGLLWNPELHSEGTDGGGALEKINVTAIGSVGEIACIDFAKKYNVRCTIITSPSFQTSYRVPTLDPVSLVRDRPSNTREKNSCESLS